MFLEPWHAQVFALTVHLNEAGLFDWPDWTAAFSDTLARHGLENHRDRALVLLYRATQRFSMEFYIRPFLNRWQDETLRVLHDWAEDDHYHVRRLVSEGTRPKLPWAQAVNLAPCR